MEYAPTGTPPSVRTLEGDSWRAVPACAQPGDGGESASRFQRPRHLTRTVLVVVLVELVEKRMSDKIVLLHGLGDLLTGLKIREFVRGTVR